MQNKMMFVDVLYQNIYKKELENTKRVTRTRKSKKNRRHNGKKKNQRRTNNVLQNIIPVNISVNWFTLWRKYHDSPVATLLKYKTHNGKSTIDPSNNNRIYVIRD